GRPRAARTSVVEAAGAQGRVARVLGVAGTEGGLVGRPGRVELHEAAEAAARLVVVLLGDDRAVGELRLEVVGARADAGQEGAGERPPPCPVRVDAPETPQD